MFEMLRKFGVVVELEGIRTERGSNGLKEKVKDKYI
jgi:hypothetical protein